MMSTIDALFFCFIVLSGTNSTVAIKLSVNDKMYFTNKFSAVFSCESVKRIDKVNYIIDCSQKKFRQTDFREKVQKSHHLKRNDKI